MGMDNSRVAPPSQDEDCPDQWMETIYESGDVMGADGIVFQCMPEPFSLQCGQYGYNPGTESLRWKRAWNLIGYCSNLGEASPQPSSPQPTPTTSYLPTTQTTSTYPTSSSYDEPCEGMADVDICIAVDSSGSICNKSPQQQQCNGCWPHNSCRDSFITEDTCCSNFHDVQVFASTLVARLDEELKGSNNFSLVQFADESSIQSELTSCDTEIQRVSEISYSGGMTNTEAALTSCHATLESSNKRKYVVLVTDGVPTTSDREGEPVHAALDAADELKMDDIFIITAFIDRTINDDSGKELMMQISSGDSLYNVADFDDLDTIVDSVAEPVLCGKDNNMEIISEGSSTPSWEQGSSTTSSWEQGSSTTSSWEQVSSTTNSQG